MSITKFVTKTIIKVTLFAFLLIIIAAIGPAIRTVINNELALAQLQPSNEAYILIDTYYALRPVVNIASIGVAIWGIISVALDVRNFVKKYTSDNK